MAKKRKAESKPASGVTAAQRDALLLPLLIANVGVLAFGNSLAGDFVFDDENDIVKNQRMSELWTSWLPTAGVWRPVTTFSFALNYALSKEPLGFHAVNMVIHILAALTLYGIVRRTLLLDGFKSRFATSAPWLALTVALLWMVHPLQTESVTYIVHRYESLMGLFYLLTLYCFLRGATSSDHARFWQVCAVVSCALGMGSKEVMVTAPLTILVYDRIFLSESWRELMRRRWPIYVGLAATWGLMARQFLAGLFPQQDWAGFGMQRVSAWDYAVSQPAVIVHYLKLCFWPVELCLDYDWPFSQTTGAIVLPGLTILALLLTSAWALWRRPALGFLGVWFFVILAPTSSVMPIADLAAERRMYLSLAAVVMLAALVGHWLVNAVGERWDLRPLARTCAASLAVGATVALLCVLTILRNQDYYMQEGIWRDVVAKRPLNPRGHHNLAVVLIQRGQYEEAVQQLEIACGLSRTFPLAFRALGYVRENQGRMAEAQTLYEKALQEDPRDARSHNLLGMLLLKQGKPAEAHEHFAEALNHDPYYAEAHNNMGSWLWQQGQAAKARQHYDTALRLKPNYAPAHDNLGMLLQSQGKDAEAEQHFARAAALDPSSADALNHLGMMLVKRGALQDARARFQRALDLNPDNAMARCNLADALWRLGSEREAREQYRLSLKVDPGWPETANKSAWQLATHPDPQRRDGARAVQLAEHLCRATEGTRAKYLDTLAAAQAETGNFDKAATTAEKARDLATAAKQVELAVKIDNRLSLYRARKPYRE